VSNLSTAAEAGRVGDNAGTEAGSFGYEVSEAGSFGYGAGGGDSWQSAMQDAVRDVGELCRLLGLPEQFTEASQAAHRDFPVFAPRGYIGRMRKGDPADPLLRQVLPVALETRPALGYVFDPVGDQAAEVAPGLLQKYHGRALLVATGVCAVHCRYCFRRHFPYSTGPKSLSDWQPALEAIRQDASIHEVILSGGDPLTLSDQRLAVLAGEIAGIGHVRRLRVHTRLPVMIPERVTSRLLGWLTGTRLAPVMVIHANHVNEIDTEVATAVTRLVDAGVPVLNQAVLLAGVNDSTAAQLALWERLVDIRVMPYYLHRLDRVLGAAHFDVPVEKGRKIVKILQERLPGYAVPRYVEESPGAPSKMSL
jgi:EF-P beta-lysylation protein EpmB